MIEYMRFHKVATNVKDSLVGFCSFRWGKEFQFTEIAVHRLKTPKGSMRIRLLFPDRISMSKETQREMDEEINAYILANYSEIFHDR